MANLLSKPDLYFSDWDELTSTCCDAYPIGEIDIDGTGRCSDCKEGTTFINLNNENNDI